MKEESFGAVAGFLAGILNALAVGPLDVVKVSLQNQFYVIDNLSML